MSRREVTEMVLIVLVLIVLFIVAFKYVTTPRRMAGEIPRAVRRLA